MKAAALLVLLTACAPLPASLPWVRIDRSLSGAVVSREAAEAWAAQRKRDNAEHAKQLVDERERADASEARERAASWWRDNAPWVVTGSGLVGILLGVVLGSQIRPR